MGTTLFTGQASAVSEIKHLIGLAWRGPASCISSPLALVLALAILCRLRLLRLRHGSGQADG